MDRIDGMEGWIFVIVSNRKKRQNKKYKTHSVFVYHSGVSTWHVDGTQIERRGCLESIREWQIRWIRLLFAYHWFFQCQMRGPLSYRANAQLFAILFLECFQNYLKKLQILSIAKARLYLHAVCPYNGQVPNPLSGYPTTQIQTHSTCRLRRPTTIFFFLRFSVGGGSLKRMWRIFPINEHLRYNSIRWAPGS